MDDAMKIDVEKLKGSDLSPAMMKRESAPKKTWFFQRGDGLLFPCEEKEAWDICNNRSTWKRRDFKYVGVSDGTTYQKIVKGALGDAKRLEPELEKLRIELNRYTKAHENLLTNEAVDMEGDPSDTVNEANKAKAIRLEKIIDRLDEQLEEKEKEYRAAVGGAVKRATDAELEVAKANTAAGKIEWPSDVNIITPSADAKQRRKILKVMGESD